ncbi:MAG: GNAT family N-acetyltransferase [Flavobacteriales bacterium]|nr:GNAT family N-acetyltransferase [Flavobacteriales bacterium]
MFQVKKYHPQYKNLWDDFVSKAKNATFLFHRDFMEYHSDRFEDCSLLLFEDKKVVALLPANKVGNELFSHQGLTFGGFLTKNIRTDKYISFVRYMLEYLKKMGIKKLHIKQIPTIYVNGFNSVQDYILYICNVEVFRKDSLSVISLQEKFSFSNSRKEGIKRGIKNGLVVKEEENQTAFWNEILEPNLLKKYNVKPVHSVGEIILLKQKFPKNIRQFNVYKENKIVGGTTIFETPLVAHAQYISANEDKNQLGSLDFLFNHLITKVFSEKKYFDFGASNENNGKQINKGLLFWKEGFGAQCEIQSFYTVSTKNHTLLEAVLLYQ